MKKAFLALAALLLCALAAVLATDQALPDTSRAEASIMGDGGMIFAVENGPLTSVVYGLNSGGDLVFFYRENVRDGSTITRLSWGGDRLYFLREVPTDTLIRWEVVALDESARAESVGTLTAKDYRATGLAAPGYIAAVAADGSGSAAVFDAVTGVNILRRTAPEEGRMLCVTYLPEEDALLAVLDADGTTAKVGRTGVYPTVPAAAPTLPRQVSVSPSLRVMCKGPLLLLTGAAVVVLELLVMLIVLLFLRGKRLFLRATAVSTATLLLALCLMAGLLLVQSARLRLEERLDQTEHTAMRLAAALAVEDPACVLRGDFYGSREQGRFSVILSTEGGSELLAYQNHALSVACSSRTAYGLPVEYAYDPQVISLAIQATQGERASALLTLDGKQTAISAAPLYSSGVPVGVVLASAGIKDIQAAALRTGTQLALIGLMAAALACVVLVLLLRRVTRPIGQLKDQMEAVSAGNLKVRQVQPGLDELGEMARSMQEMCMSLSIRQYEVQSTIDSYNRFVPRGLCQLLDRASVMEVSFGDVRSIEGNVTLVSVNNRDEARHALEDGPFVAFVNDTFSAVDRNARAHGGFLLSSGLDMGAMRLYYPGKASSAVCAGLDLLGESRVVHPGGTAPDFFLLLHRTAFLYGIAGTQDEAFPFLSCQEMEFLASYSSRFAATGARVVLTNAFLKQMEPGYITRYIGYVSAPDTGASYKLYELLDAYPELERNLRIRYDARFQEAIQLFYKSDYYLARNLFSALLRACPGDGVARWYLFACEHYFNSGVQGEPDCRLFSIEE